MPRLVRGIHRCAAPAFLALVCSLGLAKSEMKKGGWDEIPAEELEASEPRIDPTSACEFLFRELKVDDAQADRTIFSYHNRAKIYSEAGVEAWRKIDIGYETGWYVTDLKARVIYPDGTVTNLSNKEVFKRQIYKNERFEGYAKSFSFPGLRPGCIVEYRWKKVRKYWMPGLEIPLRAEWPTWDFKTHIRPYRGWASSVRIFNAAASWEKARGGFAVEISDQPAISDKAHLAPRKDFEPFIALGYAHDIEVFDPNEYWGYRGGSLVELNKDFIKGKDRQVKKLAEELFAGVTFNDDKLRVAYKYCAEQIVNIDEPTTKYSEQEIEDLKKNERPSHTINNGYGTRYDINAVFASLAAAAGFSAHLAQVEDHRECTFNPLIAGSFNLSNWVVAIRQGEDWRYFDPGSSFLPFETLNPNNVDGNVIVTDKKYYYMRKTPAVPAEASQESRLAEVVINEHGDLEAKVNIQYKGFSGLWRKRMFVSLTDTEKKEYVLEEEWSNRLPRAEIHDFSTRNEKSRDEPLRVSYTVKIPGYADVLGDRVIFNPSLFAVGERNPFPERERVEPIAFDYQPLIIDKISYALPEGLEIEDEYATHVDFEGGLIVRKSRMSRDVKTGLYVYDRLYSLRTIKVAGHFYTKVREEFESLVESDSRPVSFSGTLVGTAGR